jgi:hypothetical protein
VGALSILALVFWLQFWLHFHVLGEFLLNFLVTLRVSSNKFRENKQFEWNCCCHKSEKGATTHNLMALSLVQSMFVERKVRYTALFTNLVGWHAGTVSFPLSDVILAQLAYPLCDIMFCLHSGMTNLSLYKHWEQWSIMRLLTVPSDDQICTLDARISSWMLYHCATVADHAQWDQAWWHSA